MRNGLLVDSSFHQGTLCALWTLLWREICKRRSVEWDTVQWNDVLCFQGLCFLQDKLPCRMLCPNFQQRMGTKQVWNPCVVYRPFSAAPCHKPWSQLLWAKNVFCGEITAAKGRKVSKDAEWEQGAVAYILVNLMTSFEAKTWRPKSDRLSGTDCHFHKGRYASVSDW